jgi:hypothetical protein
VRLPFHLLAAALLGSTVAAAAPRSAPRTAEFWAKYPSTAALQAFRTGHHPPSRGTGPTPILVMTWFLNGDRVALSYRVDSSGYKSDSRIVHDWAVQATRKKQLSRAELQALYAHLDQLPESAAPPPLSRLVVASFRRGGQWTTRCYDSAALPCPLKAVVQLLGERSETKDRQKGNPPPPAR